MNAPLTVNQINAIYHIAVYTCKEFPCETCPLTAALCHEIRSRYRGYAAELNLPGTLNAVRKSMQRYMQDHSGIFTPEEITEACL